MDETTSTSGAPRRKSLVPALLALAWIQTCVLLGQHVLAPRRGEASPASELTRQIAASRRRQYQRSRDPRPGVPAPALSLRTAEGAAVDPNALRGRRTAVLFVQEGGT